jgi:uncharacterized cupin superfamily protein
MSAQRIVNLADVPLKENGDGNDFVARIGRAGAALGSTGLGCTLTVVPPGKRAYPFHRHHVIDELFYVLDGSGTCRIGDASFPVRAGDLIAAPAGAEAHQIVNTSDRELRYLGFSTIGSVDIVEYPDSGKMAAAAGIRNADFTTATFKTMGRVQPAGYFDDESPKDRGAPA